MKKSKTPPATTDAARTHALHVELAELIAELECEVDACVAAQNIRGLLYMKAQLITVRDLPFEDKERLMQSLAQFEIERAATPQFEIGRLSSPIVEVTPTPETSAALIALGTQLAQGAITVEEYNAQATNIAPPVSESVTRKAQRAQ